MDLNQDEKKLLADLLEGDLFVNEEFYYNNGEKYKLEDNNWTFIKVQKLLEKLK